MKRIMPIGRVGCGKTLLCQCLAGQELHEKKTQTVEVVGGTAIDTPGEYLENKNFYKALVVTAVEADCILLVQACDDAELCFSPRMYGMFNRPMIGVLTKLDLAKDPKQINNLADLLCRSEPSVSFASAV